MVTPSPLSTGVVWPQAVSASFGVKPVDTWLNVSPASVWREVRERAGVSIETLSRVDAESAWADVLQKNGAGRRIDVVEGSDSYAQLARWLDIQADFNGRLSGLIDPRSLGFRDVDDDSPLIGDLVTSPIPLLAEVGIVTGVAENGCLSEVLFIMGGRIFLGHPALVGEGPEFWRGSGEGPKEIRIGRSSSGRKTMVHTLDRFLDLDERLTLDDSYFGPCHKSSGPGLAWGWFVLFDFVGGEFATISLDMDVAQKEGRLAAAIHYCCRDELTSRFFRFVQIAEKMLQNAATSSGFSRLDLYYNRLPTVSDDSFYRRFQAMGYQLGERLGLSKKIIL